MTIQHDRALDVALGKNYTVYKHTSPDGKVYIGVTSDKLQHRWRGGHGYESNPHFARAIRKHGWDAFRHEVIAEGLTPQEAEQMEIALIAQYDSTNPAKGYNRDTGGRRRSPETMAKVSATLTGVKWTDERRAKASRDRKGRKLTEECKRNISVSHKHNPRVQEHILALNRARAGTPKTEQHRQRISESQPSRRAVVNLDTGETFSCVNDAAKACGGSRPNIIKACKGERSTAYGYRWAYKEVIT